MLSVDSAAQKIALHLQTNRQPLLASLIANSNNIQLNLTKMSRVTKFLQLACEEASKSSMYFRHGALIVKGGKAVALGKNSSEQIKHRERYCSIHSEIDAMSRFECGFTEKGEK